MIEPRAVAILTSAYSALEGGDTGAHHLLSELIGDLDAKGLAEVVESMAIAVVDLLDRLNEEHPGFEPDAWIRRLGLIAAGAR